MAFFEVVALYMWNLITTLTSEAKETLHFTRAILPAYRPCAWRILVIWARPHNPARRQEARKEACIGTSELGMPQSPRRWAPLCL